MNCEQLNTQLDAFLDAQTSAEFNALTQHLNSCQHCQQQVAKAKAVRQALLELPFKPASANFEERVLGEVRRQHKNHGQNHFVAGFGSAVAAGLALWFASTLFIPSTQTLPTESVNIAMHSVNTVKLMFEVPEALAEVTLSIELPDNVELQGYPGQQQLSWKTRLKKGQNILVLPVLATESVNGELIAQLKYGDKTKSLRIILKSTQNGVYQYKLLPQESA